MPTMKNSALCSAVALSFLLLAGCKTTGISNPCDILVQINPKKTTNSYMIQNDRLTAEQIAKHRGRFQKYKCG